MIPETMKKADLSEATLVSLSFCRGPLVSETDVLKGREILTCDPATAGTLVFVVRRPG